MGLPGVIYLTLLIGAPFDSIYNCISGKHVPWNWLQGNPHLQGPIVAYTWKPKWPPFLERLTFNATRWRKVPRFASFFHFFLFFFQLLAVSGREPSLLHLPTRKLHCTDLTTLHMMEGHEKIWRNDIVLWWVLMIHGSDRRKSVTFSWKKRACLDSWDPKGVSQNL